VKNATKVVKAPKPVTIDARPVIADTARVKHAAIPNHVSSAAREPAGRHDIHASDTASMVATGGARIRSDQA